MSLLPYVDALGRRLVLDVEGRREAGSALYRAGRATDELRICATYWPLRRVPCWHLTARYSSTAGRVVDGSATGSGFTLAEAEIALLDAARAELPVLFELLTGRELHSRSGAASTNAA